MPATASSDEDEDPRLILPPIDGRFDPLGVRRVVSNGRLYGGQTTSTTVGKNICRHDKVHVLSGKRRIIDRRTRGAGRALNFKLSEVRARLLVDRLDESASVPGSATKLINPGPQAGQVGSVRRWHYPHQPSTVVGGNSSDHGKAHAVS